MIRIKQNLRKMVATTICLAVSSMMFSSCSQSAKETKANLSSEAKQEKIVPLCQDEGVVINGVKWATRNVDKPGTFATKPEDLGMLYQWNCRVGWSATDPIINSNGGTAWNGIIKVTCTIWEKSNDPSPVGWRVPTSEEIKKLLDEEKVNSEWVTENGVEGRRFTDKANGNTIFLPAVYSRDNNGVLTSMYGFCYYWLSVAVPYHEMVPEGVNIKKANDSPRIGIDNFCGRHSFSVSVRSVSDN